MAGFDNRICSMLVAETLPYVQQLSLNTENKEKRAENIDKWYYESFIVFSTRLVIVYIK